MLMRFVLALFAVLLIAGAALAETTPATVKLIPGSPGATIEGGPGYNLFYGGPGGVTLTAPAGSVNRFVFGNAADSNEIAHQHILYFDPATDMLDLSAICRGKCSGPYKMTCAPLLFDPRGIDPPLFDPACFDKGKGALYYQFIPEPKGFFTAVFGDFTGSGHPDFYLAIEGGKLALDRRNFDFGAR